MNGRLTRLYPPPSGERPVAGTYLAHDVRRLGVPERPFVYANFVSSLDGRISQIDREMGRLRPPRAISSEHDWRLYRELAAQAEVVVTSCSRVCAMLQENRDWIECVEEFEEGDIAAWRRERSLPPRPTCIVLGKDLDFPIARFLERSCGDFIFLVGAQADRNAARKIEAGGFPVKIGRHRWVVGEEIEAIARERGFRTLYLIGGPDVLYTMLDARRLDRLYLTVAHLALGGRDYDTLVRGDALMPPSWFRLNELYLDSPEGNEPELGFVSYDTRRS
ncbi:MAG: RibD family protein [Sulfurifustaceae bacterium]